MSYELAFWKETNTHTHEKNPLIPPGSSDMFVSSHGLRKQFEEGTRSDSLPSSQKLG